MTGAQLEYESRQVGSGFCARDHRAPCNEENREQYRRLAELQWCPYGQGLVPRPTVDA